MDTDPKFNSILVPLVAVSALFILFSFYGAAFATITVRNLASITTAGGAPTRIAADGQGILYAAVPASGKVFKFFRDGSPAGVITDSQKPLSVAADSTGKVYVGDYVDGSVRALGPDGRVLYSLGQGKGEFRMPGDIAVSSSGLVYVTDSMNNMVKIYNQDGTFRSSFGGYGTGPGKMIFPTGICSDNLNDEIYVIDQTNGRVEVFDPDGIFRRSFGSYGSGQGMLTRGQGIHVANGKVYVADAYQSRVEVFDTAGNFVSFIGSYGNGLGSLKIPMDVMMVGTTLYVANSDNGRLELFDIGDQQGLDISPAILSFTADAGTNPLPQTVSVNPAAAGSGIPWTATVSAPFGLNLSASSGNTPAQVEVGVDLAGLSDGTYNGAVIFHAAGNDYPVAVTLAVSPPPKQLIVSPTSISLSHGNGILGSQAVSVSSGGGPLSWSASADASWLTLSPAAGTTPANYTVSVNASADMLVDGVYSGTITVMAPEAGNSPITVTVTLTVARQSILVTPGRIDMLHEIYGDLATDNLSVSSIGGSLDWSVSSDAQWLSIQPSAGTTPAVVALALNRNADALAEGTHTGQVTITSPNAVNSPVHVPVTVKVTAVKTGTVIVTSNLESTTFTISGTTASDDAITLTGYGTNWRTDEAKPGAYTIHFGHIQGYRRPADRDFDITAGETVSIDVAYQKLAATDVIVAAKGPDPKNDATVRILDLDGNLINEFSAMSTKFGARIAMGDIDGDGVDEIIAAPGSGISNSAQVRVFHNNGSLVTETALLGKTFYGGSVAAGDIDGDGRAEIALSIIGLNGARSVIVYAFDGFSLVEKAKISLKEAAYYQAAIAFGDIDGDGRGDLICASSGRITVYAFDPGLSDVSVMSMVAASTLRSGLREQVTVAAGDIDGDGVDEVLAGYDNGTDSLVQALNANLKAVSPPLKVFDRVLSSPAISARDINGDGRAEILAGQGARSINNAGIRVYDFTGRQIKEISAFYSKYGVNAAFGAVGEEGREGASHAE